MALLVLFCPPPIHMSVPHRFILEQLSSRQRQSCELQRIGTPLTSSMRSAQQHPTPTHDALLTASTLTRYVDPLACAGVQASTQLSCYTCHHALYWFLTAEKYLSSYNEMHVTFTPRTCMRRRVARHSRELCPSILHPLTKYVMPLNFTAYSLSC